MSPSLRRSWRGEDGSDVRSLKVMKHNGPSNGLGGGMKGSAWHWFLVLRDRLGVVDFGTMGSAWHSCVWYHVIGLVCLVRWDRIGVGVFGTMGSAWRSCVWYDGIVLVCLV